MTVFNPGGTNLVLTSSSTSGSLVGSGDVLRLTNTGNQDVYVKSGVGAQSPSAGDFLVRPGVTAFLQIAFADDTAAISTSSGGQIYILRGSAR
jgi:hypothetical protein